MKKLRNLFFALFTLMIFSFCLSFDTQAVMSDEQVKSRLSEYSESYIKTKDGVCFFEYKDWDASEDEMYEVISGMARQLMGEPVEDYCRADIKFFFTHKPYGSDFETFFDKLSLVKKKFGNFFTEWSRFNKLTMSVTSYSGGEYFSANFKLYFNGSEQDKYGKAYDDKLLSLVNQARQECDSNMETAQFFLRWLDENASYLILTGYSNDPRYALNVGYTVCGGYANAFKDLCNAAGIPAIVPVNQQANHAWSRVYIDGIWYTADLCNVVKSKSGIYDGYLFTDPDLSTDCEDFIKKYAGDYVDSYKYSKNVNLSQCTFEYKNSYSYSGKIITPALKVKFGNKELKAGEHFNIVYTANKYPGTGKMILKGVRDNGYSGSKTLTFKINLPTVKVTATPGKNSVKLSWTAAKGVDGYIIRIYNSHTEEYENLSTVRGTSCTVKNLSPGKKYKFAVRTYVSENGNIYRGDNCKVSSFTFPGKVKKLRAVSLTDSSLKLKWTAIETAKKYEVQISTDGKKWKTKATVKKNSYTVKDLSANKRYYFRVRAVSDYGKGVYSSKMSVSTLLPGPEVNAVSENGKINVSWNKISGAKGYVVAYARNRDMMNNKKVTVKKGSKVSATLKGLKAKKNYYVRVRAYKTVDGERVYGSYSKTIKVKVK